MRPTANTRIFSITIMPMLALTLMASGPASAQSEPYIGQLMPVAFNFCPRGWAEADGQLLSVSENITLFSLLGTTYGGDGRTTFGLPDLRGRGPIHEGQGPGLASYRLGQKGGREKVTLQVDEMPSHKHEVQATNAIAEKGGPGDKFLAAASPPQYHEGPPNRLMNENAITSTGGSKSVSIRDPYLTVKWCIALVGVFPPRG